MGFSDKTYSIPYGAGRTAFFAESEPDGRGIVRGTIALDVDEATVLNYEAACVHVNELTDEIQGVVWPEVVTA